MRRNYSKSIAPPSRPEANAAINNSTENLVKVVITDAADYYK